MQSWKILIVDDEETILEVFREVLEDEGHQVHCCLTGEEAQTLLETASFDLAFLDVKLPGISGIDLLKEIRSRPSSLRVVMITGVLDDDLYDLSIYSGHAADGFITKPCSFRSIRDCIERVMVQDASFLKTQRDELRYAVSKVQRSLQRRGQTLSTLEYGTQALLTHSLATCFQTSPTLVECRSLLSPQALRRVSGAEVSQFRAGPEASLELAREVREESQSDWGLSLTLLPSQDLELPNSLELLLGIRDADQGSWQLQKRLSGTPEEMQREAVHRALVHLYAALRDGS